MPVSAQVVGTYAIAHLSSKVDPSCSAVFFPDQVHPSELIYDIISSISYFPVSKNSFLSHLLHFLSGLVNIDHRGSRLPNLFQFFFSFPRSISIGVFIIQFTDRHKSLLLSMYSSCCENVLWCMPGHCWLMHLDITWSSMPLYRVLQSTPRLADC